LSKKNIYLTIGILWFAISFYLLTIPGKELPQISWMDTLHVDKLVHITMFFLLSYLFSYPVRKSSRKYTWMLLIAISGLLYGIAMEFVQKYYIPFRSCDVEDMVADGIGSFAGYFWWRIKLKKQTIL